MICTIINSNLLETQLLKKIINIYYESKISNKKKIDILKNINISNNYIMYFINVLLDILEIDKKMNHNNFTKFIKLKKEKNAKLSLIRTLKYEI